MMNPMRIVNMIGGFIIFAVGLYVGSHGEVGIGILTGIVGIVYFTSGVID